jgi:hypothetical protein
VTAVPRKPIHTALLVMMVLWCTLLVGGAFLWAFVGMLFAGEPAGGGIGAREFWVLSLPLLQTGLLSAALFILWKRQYYVWALVAWLLSVIFVIYTYHGYFM